MKQNEMQKQQDFTNPTMLYKAAYGSTQRTLLTDEQQ